MRRALARRPARVLLAGIALALTGIVTPQDGPAAASSTRPPTAATSAVGGNGCRFTTVEPERMSGALRLRGGQAVRRTHPAGGFRNGTVTARFVVPRGVPGRLSLSVGADGFQGTLTRQPGVRPVLAIRWHSTNLVSRQLHLAASAGQRIKIRVRQQGRSVAAVAWPAARARPEWQIRTTHQAAARGSGRGYVAAQLASGSAVVGFSGATVAIRRRHGAVGVYNGMYEHHRTVALLGHLPAVDNSYYQPDQTVIVAREAERIRRGISPNITITTKGTDYIAALGVGPRHPHYRRASAWLDRYVAGLARIAGRNANVPVYATLEHEFKFKVRLGLLTGQSANPRIYGRALRRFYARARAADPAIRVTYWIVADNSDRAAEWRAGRQLRTPPDAILFDPYASSAGERIRGMVRGDVAWIKRQRWYVGQEIALGEFGMPVAFGDAALEAFYTRLQPTLRSAGLSWGVFFNRPRDLNTQIAGRTDGRRYPRAVSAFRASLGVSARC